MNRTLSVILSTYRRPAELARALRSLQDQSLQEFEIIAVDNAADPQVEALVAGINRTTRHAVRYLREERLGLHFARHTGARQARGEVLVFTDDDATFEPGWLAAYAAAFATHPEMSAAGGPVRPAWDASPPAWLERFAAEGPYCCALSLLDFGSGFLLSPQGVFFGVNMAIRREGLFAAGGFHPELFGEVCIGDGEAGLNAQLSRQGSLIGYVPEAGVHHHIAASRMTLDSLLHWARNWGASFTYTRYHPDVPAWPALTLALAGYWIKYAPLWVLVSLCHHGQLDVRSLQRQMRAVSAWEEIRYMRRLLHDAEFRRLVEHRDWLNAPAAAT